MTLPSPRPLRACLLLTALALALPPSAAAQSSVRLTPYVSAGQGAQGDLVLIGAGLSVLAGPVGVRFGGGYDARGTPLGQVLSRPGDADAPHVWGADLDGLLFLSAHPDRASLAPYAIGTVGVRASRFDSELEPHFHLGYGGGLRVRVSDFVALELESRQLMELDSRGAGTMRRAGLEHRAGLSLRVGTESPRRPATSPATRPGEPRPPTSTPAAAGAVARRTIETGEAYLGTRYVWGGSRPAEGFDCSGFIQYVYRRNGIELPRVSRDQARAGWRLPADLSALEPGDLMFFASNGSLVDHVAIYTGNGRILHSSASAGAVVYDDLRSRRGDWYVRHFVAARRVLDAGWFGAGGFHR